jgi:hypothetical protein
LLTPHLHLSFEHARGLMTLSPRSCPPLLVHPPPPPWQEDFFAHFASRAMQAHAHEQGIESSETASSIQEPILPISTVAHPNDLEASDVLAPPPQTLTSIPDVDDAIAGPFPFSLPCSPASKRRSSKLPSYSKRRKSHDAKASEHAPNHAHEADDAKSSLARAVQLHAMQLVEEGGSDAADAVAIEVKQPRTVARARSTSSSLPQTPPQIAEAVLNGAASSRKNKLQRCSACGGLGHKSRTCTNKASCAEEPFLQPATKTPRAKPVRRSVARTPSESRAESASSRWQAQRRLQKSPSPPQQDEQQGGQQEQLKEESVGNEADLAAEEECNAATTSTGEGREQGGHGEVGSKEEKQTHEGGASLAGGSEVRASHAKEDGQQWEKQLRREVEQRERERQIQVHAQLLARGQQQQPWQQWQQQALANTVQAQPTQTQAVSQEPRNEAPSAKQAAASMPKTLTGAAAGTVLADADLQSRDADVHAR